MAISNSNKLTIVTGASGGIGSEIAQLFLLEGYEVIGIDKHSNDVISNERYTHFNCDVRDYKELQSIIEKIECREINALINCVGIREICSISDLSIEQWEEVMAINVSSVFVSSKAFAEKIKLFPKSTGSIVTIASVSGLLGEPQRTAYVTSKHAVIGLTKQLAIEYGKYGIRANTVAPGVVRTSLTEHYYKDAEQLKKIASGQFIDYFATPEDIGPLVLFLTSEHSKFITGATMVADGGWSAGKMI